MDDWEARDLIRRLRKHAGATYAAEAGITLRDAPMPLFQLLALCMLASKPIDATIAMRAAKELFRAGLRAPNPVLTAERSAMIEAFGRAQYVRFDESSASRLTDLAERVDKDYRGDLRLLARGANSPGSATPWPTSFCVRYKTYGPGSGHISTSELWRPRGNSGSP